MRGVHLDLALFDTYAVQLCRSFGGPLPHCNRLTSRGVCVCVCFHKLRVCADRLKNKNKFFFLCSKLFKQVESRAPDGAVTGHRFLI